MREIIISAFVKYSVYYKVLIRTMSKGIKLFLFSEDGILYLKDSKTELESSYTSLHIFNKVA